MNASGTLNGVNVAITGTNGYIGSALADALQKLSSNTLGVGLRTPYIGVCQRTIDADVRAYDCWVEIVKHASVIFHLAGNTSVYDAARDPIESLNSALLPITHLIRAAREVGRKPRVVFASTATVYGSPVRFPVSESTEPAPITIYDLHKLYAEQYLALATRSGVLGSVSLRLANVYGPSVGVSSAPERGILNRVATMAMRGHNLTVYGEGDYFRDYVYIGDVVSALLLASTTPGIEGKAFNVTTGVGTTIRQAFELIADEAASVTGVRVRCESAPWPLDADAIEFRNFVGSNVRLASETGWQPVFDLRAGIQALVTDYYRRQQQ